MPSKVTLNRANYIVKPHLNFWCKSVQLILTLNNGATKNVTTIGTLGIVPVKFASKNTRNAIMPAIRDLFAPGAVLELFWIVMVYSPIIKIKKQENDSQPRYIVYKLSGL